MCMRWAAVCVSMRGALQVSKWRVLLSSMAGKRWQQVRTLALSACCFCAQSCAQCTLCAHTWDELSCAHTGNEMHSRIRVPDTPACVRTSCSTARGMRCLQA